MFLREHSKSSCFVVIVTIILGAPSAGTLFAQSDEAAERVEELLFPAQTIKLGLSMSVKVKVDGAWRKCRSSDMEYYLPECTDRRFTIFAFAKDYTGYLKEMKRHNIRRIQVSVDHFPIKEVEELGMLEHFLVIEFGSQDDIDFEDVAALAKMPNLEKLDIAWCTKVHDLRPLGKLKHLKSLTIPVNSTDASIKMLQKSGVLARLRHFWVGTSYRNPGITDYSFIEGMKNLESLSLAVPHSSQLSSYLTKVPSLKDLFLRRYVGDTSFLLDMPQLRKLTILCDLGKPSLDHIAELPNLEELTLLGTPTFNIDLTPLSTLTKREGLRITVNKGQFRDYDFSDTSLAGICFKRSDFTGARFVNTVVTGTNFAPLFYSVKEDKMVPSFGNKNVGLTLDQIKSTWNYKHNRMEGITLPKELAAALELERTAEGKSVEKRD